MKNYIEVLALVYRVLSRGARFRFFGVIGVLLIGSLAELLPLLVIYDVIRFSSGQNITESQSVLLRVINIVGSPGLRPSDPTISVLVVSVLLILTSLAVRLFAASITSKLTSSITNALSVKAFEASFDQDLLAVNSENSSTLIHSIYDEPTLTQTHLVKPFLDSLLALFSGFVVLLSLFAIDRISTILIILFSTAIYSLVYIAQSKDLSQHSRRLPALGRSVYTNISQTKDLFTDIILYGLRDRQLQVFRKNNSELRSMQAKLIFIKSYPRYVLECSLSIMVLIIIGLGALYDRRSLIEPSILVSLLLGCFKLYSYAQKIISSQASYKAHKSTFKNLKSTFYKIPESVQYDYPTECLADRSCTQLNGSTILDLHDISFGYARDGKKIINSLSLQIQPGRITCLVGPSGAGKTTLMNICMGLIKPTSGYMAVNGYPLISYQDVVGWRRSISHVSQNCICVEGTVLENIVLEDRSSVDLERIRWLLHEFGLHTLFESDGLLDAKILANGSNMSGGQRQRLAIVRALARPHKAIFLDEAMSAQDARSEEKIWSTLQTLCSRIPIITISHRPIPETINSKLVYL